MRKKICAVAILIAPFMFGCEQNESAEQKVAEQTSKVYQLNDSERSLANINAKQYFEKEWLPAGNARGQVINCRPTDSNFNGLVSCSGYVPLPPEGRQFREAKMFCGYKPSIVGCSDQDTVN